MPNEFASFTPNSISGEAKWLDLWNADLFWGISDARNINNKNQVQFRTDPTTWSHGINVNNPNGVVQALFKMPSPGYFLGISVLSSSPSSGTSYITLRVDNTIIGNYDISGEGVEIPVLVELDEGLHSVSLIQRSNIHYMVGNPFIGEYSYLTGQLTDIDFTAGGGALLGGPSSVIDSGADLWFHSLTCFEV